MIIYVDIDGTICTLNSSDDENKDQSFDPAGYEDAQPIEENIDKIIEDFEQDLYDNVYLNFSYPVPPKLLEKLATKIGKT